MLQIEFLRISHEIGLECMPQNLIYDMPTLVQVMAWCQPGEKPLCELMLTHFVATIWYHYATMV